MAQSFRKEEVMVAVVCCCACRNLLELSSAAWKFPHRQHKEAHAESAELRVRDLDLDVLVRVEDALGIKDVLDLLHVLDALGRLCVSDLGGLHEAEAMLGADGALDAGRPFVDVRLDDALDLGVVRLGDNVDVEVAVADVAVAADGADVVALAVDAVLVEARAHVLHQRVHLVDGHGEVVLEHLAHLARRLGDALSQRPQALQLCFVLGQHAVLDRALLHEVLEQHLQLLVVVVLVRAARLDEHVEGVPRLERIAHTGGGVLLHHVERRLVEELKGRQDLAAVLLDLAKDGLHRVVRVERKNGHVDRRGSARRSDGDAGDEADSALGADEELLEVKAGVVLAQRRERVHDGAVRQHHLEAEHGAVQAAVAEEAQAAGIGSDVASDVTRALGTEVERHHVTLLANVVVEALEDAACVAYERAGHLVERADLVEAAELDDDLIEYRYTATDKTRVASLRHDGDVLRMAVLHDLGDLAGGLWLEHELRPSVVLVHPVIVECVELARVDWLV
ncbi:hypothetical protein L1887_47106 [Cichorium endivia]|nr:hypothetical protein L1887_47106 [Cichorium endivia]